MAELLHRMAIQKTPNKPARASLKRSVRQRNARMRKSSPQTKDSGPSVAVGARLKHVRLTKGFTLRQLAKIVECSDSMISKVENDKLRPSLSMLHRLAAALGTNISTLFSDQERVLESVHIFRDGDRESFQVDSVFVGGKGASFERLLPITRSGLLQAHLITAAPGTRNPKMNEHNGEDFGYVIEGDLELLVGGEVYALHRGDAFSFPSSLPHGWRNASNGTAHILWINTPPTF
jgi:transcriptional regulator with XRE-family HTH domain